MHLSAIPAHQEGTLECCNAGPVSGVMPYHESNT
jgi:hypothetical protein